MDSIQITKPPATERDIRRLNETVKNGNIVRNEEEVHVQVPAADNSQVLLDIVTAGPEYCKHVLKFVVKEDDTLIECDRIVKDVIPGEPVKFKFAIYLPLMNEYKDSSEYLAAKQNCQSGFHKTAGRLRFTLSIQGFLHTYVVSDVIKYTTRKIEMSLQNKLLKVPNNVETEAILTTSGKLDNGDYYLKFVAQNGEFVESSFSVGKGCNKNSHSVTVPKWCHLWQELTVEAQLYLRVHNSHDQLLGRIPSIKYCQADYEPQYNNRFNTATRENENLASNNVQMMEVTRVDPLESETPQRQLKNDMVRVLQENCEAWSGLNEADFCSYRIALVAELFSSLTKIADYTPAEPSGDNKVYIDAGKYYHQH